MEEVRALHTWVGVREIRAVWAKRGTSGGWREAEIPEAVEEFRIEMLETGREWKAVEMKIWRFNDGNDEAPLSRGRALLPISIQLLMAETKMEKAIRQNLIFSLFSNLYHNLHELRHTYKLKGIV